MFALLLANAIPLSAVPVVPTPRKKRVGVPTLFWLIHPNQYFTFPAYGGTLGLQCFTRMVSCARPFEK